MKCKVRGCKFPVKVKMRRLCDTHYQHWAKNNRTRGKMNCDVDGCLKYHYALGYCRPHYMKFKKYGQPTRPEKPVTYCECGEEAAVAGKCKRCYALNYYYKSSGRGWTGKYATTKPVPKYEGAHGRLRLERGRAKEHDCVECGGPAHEWALKADATDLLFSELGARKTLTAYSLNFDDYQPMCRDCHKAYDAEHQNRNYKLRPARWEAAQDEQNQATEIAPVHS